jgi:transcriptional regulator with XRE-family HTH domain
MSKISKRLGANMKKIRMRKKMSQGDVCRKIGMDRSYMSAIESGKHNITIEILEKLADALGVAAADLLK